MERGRHVVSVFGSSRPSPGDPEYAMAYEVGAELARAGFIVCSGGYGGIMEAVSRGAKDVSAPQDGSATIGIITSAFGDRKANRWVDTVVEAGTFVERLLKLISIADGYVLLRGGTGTLLELAAVWEFMNKGMMGRKPAVVLGSFWSPVVETMRRELTWEGRDAAHFLRTASTPAECAGLLAAAFGAQNTH